MIAWWGWLLIWSGLVLALVGMLAAFAVGLFRKAMTLFDASGELMDDVTGLDIPEARPEPATRAILAGVRQVRLEREERSRRRDQERHVRRESRLERARRITRRDAAEGGWPEAWSHRADRP